MRLEVNRLKESHIDALKEEVDSLKEENSLLVQHVGAYTSRRGEIEEVSDLSGYGWVRDSVGCTCRT